MLSLTGYWITTNNVERPEQQLHPTILKIDCYLFGDNMNTSQLYSAKQLNTTYDQSCNVKKRKKHYLKKIILSHTKYTSSSDAYVFS